MMYTDTSKGHNFAKDPAVVRFGGTYLMYYSILTFLQDGKNKLGIGIARSTDLENWERVGEIEEEGELEAAGIGAPGALVYQGKVHLFYQTYGRFEKDAICHAWSEDGIHFIRNLSNPIVRAQGNWNNGRAIDADVCVFHQELFLYFATRDPEGKIQMQGVSKCPLDGRFERDSWVQCCEESILRPELEWEQECIEAAAAIAKGGKIYLFYGGAYNNCPQQIGVAVSEDGIHFRRLQDEPFMRNGEEGSWNASESGHPYVFEDEDGRIYLFFQGNNDNGKSWYLSRVEIGFEDGIPYIMK
ncbi:MAG: family 43 glycosylhydrolase [Lachnospiraceae bacterium]|nr:family 43 glycosylhydrolase [Lachnospiraceae bacterium]